MNFSSLIHGAIGAIVCDALLLHELSHLTRASHSTHQLVEYKFSHMKHLDLGVYPHIHLESFAHLCARIRGIEVLRIPLTHSMLVAPLSQSSADQLGASAFSTSIMFGHNSNGASTNVRGMREFFSLLLSNSTTLRVMSLYRLAGSSGDASADAAAAILASGDQARLLSQFFLDKTRCELWHRIEVLDLIHRINLIRWTQPRNDAYNKETFKEASAIAAETVMAAREAAVAKINQKAPASTASGDAVSGINHEAEDGGNVEDNGEDVAPYDEKVGQESEWQRVFTAERVLTQDQYQQYEVLALQESSNKSSKTTISSDAASPTPLRSHLRVPLYALAAMTPNELGQCVGSMPHLESINLKMCAPTESELKCKDDNIKASGVTADETSDRELPLGLMTLTRLGGDVTDRISIWSNLLSLQIMTFRWWTVRHVSFHLPQLLQLAVDDTWCFDLEDFVFDCPRLVALRMCITCTASVEVKNMIQEYSKENVRLATPPSLLTSLRNSPHLRNFNCLSLSPKSTKMDYSFSLTKEEMQKIREKARELGYPDLTEDGVETAVHRTRLFYYALSLLSCASTLEMIEFAPEYISLDEYLALFPHLRAVSQVPSWVGSPMWYRPPEEEDESHYLYQERRIVKEYSQRANRMHQRKITSELVERDHPPIAILNLCSAEMTLSLSTTIRMSTMPLLIHLRSLLLSAPTVIESSQVISQLFLSCRQLEHASLMQLDGCIDNTVFTQLPADCVRSSLVTLRIKTPCGVDPSRTFNDELLSRDLLPRLFPSLRHFEYLLMYDIKAESELKFIPESLARLSAILEPVVAPSSSSSDGAASSSSPSSSSLFWSSLTFLVIRQNRSSCPNSFVSEAVSHLRQSFAERFGAMWRERYSRTRLHSSLPQITFVEVRDQNASDGSPAGIYYWNLPHRKGAQRTHKILPLHSDPTQFSSLVSVNAVEYSCFHEHCRYHIQRASQSIFNPSFEPDPISNGVIPPSLL